MMQLGRYVALFNPYYCGCFVCNIRSKLGFCIINLTEGDKQFGNIKIFM